MVRNNAAYAGYVYAEPRVNWSSPEAVRSNMDYIDLRDEKPILAGGIPVISNGRRVYADTSDSHTVIYGSSGSKKSLSVFMPLLGILAKAGENLVVTDPKGEIFARMGSYLKQQGYRIRLLNFRDYNAEGFNPLHYAYNLYAQEEYDKAALAISNIADALAQASAQQGHNIDPFWPDTAKAYIRGVIPLMFSSYKEKAVNFQNMADFFTDRTAEELKEYINDCKTDAVAAVNLKTVLAEPDRTRMSTLSTCSSFIQPFLQNQKMVQMMSHTTFELEELLRQRTALFLIMDDTTQVANTLIGILISQLQTVLVDMAFRQPKGRLKTRVNFVLDEFCSFSIPGTAESLATHRSRNIRYYLCIQSIDMLRFRYRNWESILANCQTTLFLGSTEPELVQRISDRIGTTERTEDGRERPLISTAELMAGLKKTWESKEALYFNLAEGLRFCTTLPAIEAYPAFCKGTAELPVVQHPPVCVYSYANLVRDVARGNAIMPFSRPERRTVTPERQNKRRGASGKAETAADTTDELEAEIMKELEAQFDILFGESEEGNT